MTAPSNYRFRVCGHSFEVAPLDFDDQLEVECILAGAFGPSFGAALRVAAAGVIPMFVDLLREMVGKGERFDLENLLHYYNAFVASEDGTRDPRVRQVFDDLVGVMADTGGEVLQTAITSLSLRVTVDDLRRVFDLVLFRKQRTFMLTDDGPMEVRSIDVLSRLLERDPAAKWSMLTEGLRATYGQGESAEGDQGDA